MRIIQNKWKKPLVTVAMSALLVVCIAVPQTRAALGNALSLFRAQNVKGINVSFQDLDYAAAVLKQLYQDMDGLEKLHDISHLDNATVASRYAKVSVQVKPEADEITAQQALREGMTEKMLEIDGITPDKVISTSEGRVVINLDTDELNKLADELALGEDGKISPELGGEDITVVMPSGVAAKYTYANKPLIVSLSRTPEILASGSMDYEQIWSEIIKLPVFSENIRNQLAQIKDWRTTMPVPVGATGISEVTINGQRMFVSDYSTEYFESLSGMNIIQGLVASQKAFEAPDSLDISNDSGIPQMNFVINTNKGMISIIAGSFTKEELITIAEKVF